LNIFLSRSNRHTYQVIWLKSNETWECNFNWQVTASKKICWSFSNLVILMTSMIQKNNLVMWQLEITFFYNYTIIFIHAWFEGIAEKPQNQDKLLLTHFLPFFDLNQFVILIKYTDNKVYIFTEFQWKFEWH